MISLFLYTIIIIAFIIGLNKLPKLKINTNLKPKQFSVIIPFRNEANNLNNLLNSISKLDYPKSAFEIFLIDDESTDDSLEIIKQWKTKLPNLTVLQNNRNSNSPKKDAIKVGILNANFDWIITTDADCILPNQWLQAYNYKITTDNSLFIAGPVLLQSSNNLVQQYQKLETISLLGTTTGAFGLKNPIMCNAANMGFHKNTFLEIQNKKAYSITSGDDIFTLETFSKKHPNNTHYLNSINAIVLTSAEKNWKNVIQQRIRWAAKSTAYTNTFTKLTGLIVLIIQIRIVLGIFLTPLSTSIIWITKVGVDFILILFTAQKFKQNVSFVYYLFSATLYPFINTYIGIRALFGGYKWKNRQFKR